MASHSSRQRQLENSSVVDLEDEDSDYELDLSKREPTKGNLEKSEKDDLKGQLSHGVATYVWQEGRQRASEALKVYGNIDILRPYFDVEPSEVRHRLIHSIIPVRNVDKNSKLPYELYGPTMVVLTLIAMLLYQMKTSAIIVAEGTLMGTAFGTCFGYWLGIAGLLWIAAYCSNTSITMLQLLNLLGYALVGHCIVLFVTTVWHPSHNHLFFYSAWAAFGGLSSLKMVTVLMSRTSGKAQKIILCSLVVIIHMSFLLYLHFAYHHVVEDLSAVFHEDQKQIVRDQASRLASSGNSSKVVRAIKDQAAAVTGEAVKLVTKSAKILSEQTVARKLPSKLLKTLSNRTISSG